jgi:fused signal recognition particle receptor
MKALESLSAQYGTGNWAADISLVMLGISVLALLWGLLALLRSRSRDTYRSPASSGPQGITDRTAVMGGRLEKLERALNETRTEVLRAVERTQTEQLHLRQDLEALRAGLSEASPRSESSLEAVSVDALEEGRLTEEGVPPGVSEPDELTAPDLVGSEAGVAEAVPVVSTAADLLGAESAEPESLSKRLKKSRIGLFDRLRGVFGGKPKLDPAMVEELEALLVGSDLGVKTVEALMSEVRAEIQRGDEVSEGALAATLKLKILTLLEKNAPLMPVIRPLKRGDGPLVVMMVGVNGVGKTTTTAKLAALWHESGAKVLMVAADTFRAAAVEQLQTWGARIGVPVVAGAPEAKPQTVVFDALVRGKAEGFDVVVIDTAGRLHTKSNLMQELEGIRNIADRQQPGAPHETVLVVDGSTGQNAIAQAREFNAAVPLTGLIVTKLDGTPRGGVVVAIKNELGVPVRYIGVGEGTHDLRPFIPRDFVEALFDTTDLDGVSAEVVSAHGETRRRRRRDTQPYD